MLPLAERFARIVHANWTDEEIRTLRAVAEAFSSTVTLESIEAAYNAARNEEE